MTFLLFLLFYNSQLVSWEKLNEGEPKCLFDVGITFKNASLHASRSETLILSL